MKKIGDVFTLIRNGASIKQKKGAKGLPITRIETIANKVIDREKMGYADIFEKDKYADYILENEDILMSHINSEKHLGKVAIYNKIENENIIHGMNLLLLRANKNILFPKYAKYYFDTVYFSNQITTIVKKSVNQASFTVTALKNLKIPCPPIEEQKKIANTLDKITNLIELRKKQLEKLDIFSKSLFVEMFGNPWINNKDFPIIKLKNCCLLNPAVKKRELMNKQCSFIGMSSVSENGKIDTTNVKYFSEVSKGFTYFLENDVLFAKITPCMENGKGAIAKNLFNYIGVGSTEFHILRPITEKSNSYWLYVFTSFKNFRLIAQKNMTGSAGQRRVPLSFLENYKIPLPPIELQNKFAKRVEHIDKIKSDIQDSLNKLDTLKKSLMQEYFS